MHDSKADWLLACLYHTMHRADISPTRAAKYARWYHAVLTSHKWASNERLALRLWPTYEDVVFTKQYRALVHRHLRTVFRCLNNETYENALAVEDALYTEVERMQLDPRSEIAQALVRG